MLGYKYSAVLDKALQICATKGKDDSWLACERIEVGDEITC